MAALTDDIIMPVANDRLKRCV